MSTPARLIELQCPRCAARHWTIDCDYRGEIGVVLVNHSQAPFVVRSGERIAQLVIAPVLRAELVEVESLDETERGAGGYGSTGR